MVMLLLEVMLLTLLELFTLPRGLLMLMLSQRLIPTTPMDLDTVDVDTLDLDTVDVDTLDLDTVDVDILDVDTLDVDTLDLDTVDLDTVDVDTLVLDTLVLDTLVSAVWDTDLPWDTGTLDTWARQRISPDGLTNINQRNISNRTFENQK